MTINHIDQLAQWWEGAERAAFREGDMLIARLEGEYVTYSVYPAECDHEAPAENVRILARAPKPKPAWHDAVAVIAHTDSEVRQVWVREGSTWWAEGMGLDAHELRDVTPLIEAKVTDEAVDRVLDVLHAWNDTYPAGLGTKLAAAALGLEAT